MTPSKFPDPQVLLLLLLHNIYKALFQNDHSTVHNKKHQKTQWNFKIN